MKRSFNLTYTQKKYLITAVIVLIAGIFGIDLKNIDSPRFAWVAPSPTPVTVSAGPVSDAKVVSVIDGDTFVIEGKQKVRYIGINTPEIYKDTIGKKTGEQCFANQSFLKNRELIEGKSVKLIKDVSDKDKYGRLLRYVYVGDTFVNDVLVRDGYAKTMTVKPDVKYAVLFKESQASAKNANLGIWEACPSPTPNKPPK